MSWKRLLRNRSMLASAAVFLLVAIIWGVTMTAAAQPKSLDARVTDVARQLQCLPCHGESVADSPAPWALQVRQVIRAKLQRGESEQQVVQYFVSRYGDGIRQDPPKSGFLLVMWLGPVIMLAAGAWIVYVVARQWQAMRPAAEGPDPELDGLSAEDLDQFGAILRAEIGEDDAPSAQTPSAQLPAGRSPRAPSEVG